ncbi:MULTISPECIES: RsmB/NOP family class I SAM-dependent RNA methyltransferase [Croceibacter]|jgi:16S rRNA (cytosine967-C5)-methyltransferase|uniref:RsmB/NOP family class I SAM-dependent RNA methyltransferase n=1 Tax=Croceibacter TaxID=216431 RepID=UPI000C6B8C5C|nr:MULTISPECIES: methyltransferase domain-containing protein [Croceibacter]MAM22551.1 RNA methyltransferase [Croceibacter sp.]MBG25847.1 RNA methyltransferase [Croceibacter sp.]WSP34099.1 methyltransferase domain-containing protein [Croceibacter atlanticus]|tara:strand:- start:5120 stop:6331 length:1212 start_codon:yes stop_codon:yes gene_type:complete
MRLHRNLVFATIDALRDIFNEGKYADKEIGKALKRDKRWGARDRAFIAETTYDIVRWKRLYAEIAEVKEPFSRENLFRLFAVWCVLRGINLPDWPQIEPTPTRRIKGRFDELSKIRKIRESIPDWMDELGEKELGKVWDKEIAALNEQAPVILRANSLKTDTRKLKSLLLDENIVVQPVKGYDDALQLVERQNVFTTKAFKDGLFEVQDANSQLVASFLDVENGMRVIDTCAGAGGKSLHLAALMENKGQIIALDIYANKLKELKRRARRAGAHNIEARHIDSTKVVKKLYNSADRVLIDAPCSGLGVLSRNPDAKWKLEPEFLDKLRNTQAEILNSYSKMVKSGGKMVYATCSILPSENNEQVKAFLKRDEGKDFKLIKDKSMLSSTSGYDGFYMALLEKNS